MREPCNDLNFYLNFIRNHLPKQTPGNNVLEDGLDIFKQNVTNVLSSISTVAQARSRKFARTIQPLLCGLNEKLSIEMQNGEKHLTIPVYLNRPLFVDMFEVRAGQLSGLPPGFALYQLSSGHTAEEMVSMRKMWRGCLDDSDCVSPLKIYPWFAKAILDAVVYLREREPDWQNVRFRLHAIFPTVHLTIKVSKLTPMSLLSSHPSLYRSQSRQTQQSSRYSFRSSRSSKSRVPSCRTTLSSFGRSSDTSFKTDDSETQSMRMPKEEQDTEGTQKDSLVRNAADCLKRNDVDPIPQGETESRVSHMTPPDSHMTSSSTTTEKDITDTIHLHLIPSVEGFGWPRGARHPQFLPNQRPWSIINKEWLSELQEHVKDGESYWGLQSIDPRELQAMHLKRYVPLWGINFTAANDFLVTKINEMPIAEVLNDLCELLNQLNHGVKSRMWSFLGGSTKEDVKLNTIKTGIHVHKTIPEWFMALLASVISHMKNVSDKFELETDDIDSQAELERLIKFMEKVETVCAEEPRKLMEMVDITDDAVPSPRENRKVTEEQENYTRTSTPLNAQAVNSLLSQSEKPVKNTKSPGKKPRMLYRLFRRDF